MSKLVDIVRITVIEQAASAAVYGLKVKALQSMLLRLKPIDQEKKAAKLRSFFLPQSLRLVQLLPLLSRIFL
ncbi:MAG: hypothetical protein WA869_04550 [Alloacidobacterium sp.]